VNCAAIPHELVESELFGVEKGAYTGALVSRPGRFERADGGTLFLDEIGDLPASAQAKLLRVLQEGEIERLGDQKTRKINVRVVAATNANLQELVKEGRFRSDLFYRLNAYQIVIPPLRERKQDIPLLAKHFLAKHSAIHGKKLRGFTDKAKRALLSYPWPGNIASCRTPSSAASSSLPVAPASRSATCSCPVTTSSRRNSASIAAAALISTAGETGKELREAVFNGTLTLDQIEAMLLETAVDKARGNLSSAARMLG
jgi:transcriptional regulator with GAF, ATPase, and Fis domain